jgi:hypothetical protein
VRKGLKRAAIAFAVALAAAQLVPPRHARPGRITDPYLLLRPETRLWTTDLKRSAPTRDRRKETQELISNVPLAAPVGRSVCLSSDRRL